MTLRLMYGTIAAIAAFSSGVQAGTLDQLSQNVVLLTGVLPETTVMNGVTYEIGLRRQGAQKFEPKNRTVGGTGFFVGQQRRLFLITAKHVAVQMPLTVEATMGRQGEPVRFPLCDLSTSRGAVPWKYHPTADVAALEIRLPPDVAPLIKVLAMDMLATDAISRDITLLVIGFPLGFGAGPEFAPITRETKIAGGPITFPTLGRILLLQDPSVGVYSGAPVLDIGAAIVSGGGVTARAPTLTLVGIMNATVSDETGGKFAAITPVSEIRVLIESI